MQVVKVPRRAMRAAALFTTVGAGLVAAPLASARPIPLHVGPAGITHIGLHGAGSSHATTAATSPPPGTVTSSNWSGYATVNGSFTDVSTQWIQPSVNCYVTPNSYAAFWDGLDGFSSSTVEQDGTLAECAGHRAQYMAWYETYPNPMYSFPGAGAVNPGDVLTASVHSVSPTQFTLTLTDSSIKGSASSWSGSTTQTLPSPAALSSAEVIAEAPASNYGVLPLADFGTVNFNGSTVNGAPLAAGSSTVPIAMVSRRNSLEALPSTLSGSNFSVQWY